MNKRQYEILKYLSAQTDIITLENVVKYFDISKRSFKEDLDEIKYFLRSKNIGKILNLPADKIQCCVSTKDLKKEINFQNYLLNKQERIVIESLILLFQEHFLSTSEISDVMYVSRSSVVQDTKKLKSFISNFGLELVAKTRYGIKIVGNENDIREFFWNTILTYDYLYELLKKEKMIFDKIDKKYKIIYKIMDDIESKNHIFIDDRSFNILLNYLVFSVIRMSEGKYIEEFEEIGDREVEELLLNLCKVFDLSYKKEESNYLSSLFRRIKIYTSNGFEKEILSIQLQTRKFTKIISKLLNMDLSKDYYLLENLSSHIGRIITNNFDSYLKNEEVELIVRKNIDVYNLVKSNIDIFEILANRSISDNEINYIVIYICASIERLTYQETKKLNVAIVCGSGIGTSQLLKLNLIKKFNFSNMDIFSTRKLDNYNTNNYDLIISTIDLEIENKEYVKVTPLINTNDYNNIVTEIKNILKYRDLNRIDPSINYKEDNIIENDLSYYLTKEHIHLDISADNWKEAIEYSSDALVKEGYFEWSYVKEIQDLIQKHGLYMEVAKGFLLAHASISHKVYKTGFNLVRLKKEIEFPNERKRIKFICVLCTTNEKNHLKAFFELLNLLELPSFIKLISEAEKSEQIIRALKKYK